MKVKQIHLTLVLCLFITGCATLRPESTFKLREAEQIGLPTSNIKKSNEVTAGALNVLPGIGNVYLACTSDEWYNWIIFPVNLVTWPFSIVWGVPQAVVDANTINKQATADYYSFDERGRAIFEKAKAKSENE
jgi:hypothetical protein